MDWSNTVSKSGRWSNNSAIHTDINWNILPGAKYAQVRKYGSMNSILLQASVNKQYVELIERH